MQKILVPILTKYHFFRKNLHTYLIHTTRRTWSVLAVALIILSLVSYRLDKLTSVNFIAQHRTEARADILDLSHKMENVLHSQTLVLWQLSTLISENPDITQQEVSERLQNMLGVDPRLAQVRVAPDRVVEILHPLSRNDELLGFDYRDSQTLNPLGENFMDTVSNVIVGKVKLQKGIEGFTLWAPVYTPNRDQITNEFIFWGIVSIRLNQQVFHDEAGIAEASLKYDIMVNFSKSSEDLEAKILGDSNLDYADSIDIKFLQSVYVHAVPKEGWPTASPIQTYRRSVTLLAAVGLLGLLGYFLWLSGTRRIAKTQLTDGIEALNDGFLMFDAKDRLMISNQKFGELYGLPNKVLQSGVPFSEIMANGKLQKMVMNYPEAATLWIKNRSSLHSRGVAMETIQHKVSGKVIQVSEQRTLEGCYVNLCVDVTAINHAKVTAEASSKAKTDFMNVLCHELRSPMTVILGAAGLAKNAKHLPSSKILFSAIKSGEKSASEIATLVEDMFVTLSNLVGRMTKSGDHMMRLINGMLDFAQIEAENLSMNTSVCDVKNIIEPITQQLSILSNEKGLSFELIQDQGAVWADMFRVHQILFNIVGNAIKFTEVGSIQLVVKVKTNTVVFEIHDSGPGIPEAELENIFNPFYQIDSSSTRRSGGIGMGLAISHNLAVLNGGSLTVNSTFGHGSCFMLTLPSADFSLVKN